LTEAAAKMDGADQLKDQPGQPHRLAIGLEW
jgi:hypothetical protein